MSWLSACQDAKTSELVHLISRYAFSCITIYADILYDELIYILCVCVYICIFIFEVDRALVNNTGMIRPPSAIIQHPSPSSHSLGLLFVRFWFSPALLTFISMWVQFHLICRTKVRALRLNVSIFFSPRVRTLFFQHSIRWCVWKWFPRHWIEVESEIILVIHFSWLSEVTRERPGKLLNDIPSGICGIRKIWESCSGNRRCKYFGFLLPSFMR